MAVIAAARMAKKTAMISEVFVSMTVAVWQELKKTAMVSEAACVSNRGA